MSMASVVGDLTVVLGNWLYFAIGLAADTALDLGVGLAADEVLAAAGAGVEALAVISNEL
jgi:hypothetical protein